MVEHAGGNMTTSKMAQPIFKLKIIDVNSQSNFIQSLFCNFDNINDKSYLESLGINVDLYRNQKQAQQLKEIKKHVKEILLTNSTLLKELMSNMQIMIKNNCNRVIEEFAKIFDVEYEDKQIYDINIGVCKTCPRYLSEHSFNIYAFDTPSENFETILHEMTHFYWFKKLGDLYPDIDSREYESPHLIWLISEIVVDCILTNSKLRKFIVSPPSYDYFYKTKINDVIIIDYFNNMYKNSNEIADFIKSTMNFIKDNKSYLKNLLQKRKN